MRLHFTIRDLLWLTVVAAAAVGWWLDHSRIEDFKTKASQFDKLNFEISVLKEELKNEVEIKKQLNAYIDRLKQSRSL
jgi:hypothetical protein